MLPSSSAVYPSSSARALALSPSILAHPPSADPDHQHLSNDAHRLSAHPPTHQPLDGPESQPGSHRYPHQLHHHSPQLNRRPSMPHNFHSALASHRAPPPPALPFPPHPSADRSSPALSTPGYDSASYASSSYFDGHSPAAGPRKRAYLDSFGSAPGAGTAEEEVVAQRRSARVPSGWAAAEPHGAGPQELFGSSLMGAVPPRSSGAVGELPSPVESVRQAPYYASSPGDAYSPRPSTSAYEHYQAGPAPAEQPAYSSVYSYPAPEPAPSYDSYEAPLAPSSAIYARTAYEQPHPRMAYDSPSSSYAAQPFSSHYSQTPPQSSPVSAPPRYPYQRSYSIDVTASIPAPSPYPPQTARYGHDRSASAGSATSGISNSSARPATSFQHSPYSGPSYISHAPTPLSQVSAPPLPPAEPAYAYESASTATSPVFSYTPTLTLEQPAYPSQPAYRPVTAPAHSAPSSAPAIVEHSSAPLEYESFPPQQQQQQQRQQVFSLPNTGPLPSTSSAPYYPPGPSSAAPAPRPYTAGPSPTSSSSFSTTSSSAAATGREPSPPVILPQTIPALQLASSARAVHRSSAPVLAFNPAREPAASAKQLLQSQYGVTYSVAASGASKGKAKSIDVPASCWTCGTHRAKVILRGADLTGFAPRLTFTCLDCLPAATGEDVKDQQKGRLDRLAARAEAADLQAMGLQQDEVAQEMGGAVVGSSSAGAGRERASSFAAGGSEASSATPVPPTPLTATAALATLPDPALHDKVTFKDTFSGAVDYLEGRPGGPTGAEGASGAMKTPEETVKGFPAYLKRQAMTCDVCDRIVGTGSFASLTQTPVPTFTVEVICQPCFDKYRPCSDCGGGGGRLTPGRWRCKELFPAGRRTCTLSHARNPPLHDIEYEVFRVTELPPDRLTNLEARCRLIYWNVRLRTQARPEMLERADGLATTYAQCEKLTVDGWSLLKPMLHVDVEPTRNLRRYIGIQNSTPHRRRAKPKAGAAPKPDPEEEQVGKDVSGFVLVEHDFEKGAIFLAVTMPWAIAGDAFDATTILLDETIKRVRADVHVLNHARVQQGLDPYPEPWCIWGITPFKADSRMTQSLSRRGLMFLEDYVVEHPSTDLTCFPPHRQIHIPNEFVKTFKIFIRSVTAEDGIGAPPPAVGGKAPKSAFAKANLLAMKAKKAKVNSDKAAAAAAAK